MIDMKKTIKILVVVLIVGVIGVVIHHLPNFEGLMRKIHGR
jgi:hypothetical protein